MLINCKGKLVELSVPRVMGILNCTPDSFYDGARYNNEHAIVAQAAKMLSEGADFIDMGAYSSRPDAELISEAEELERIVPAIKAVLKQFPDTIISVDTFRASIAEACIAAGAAMVNDISAGLLDENMLPTVGKLKVPYVMMHMRGNPKTMQSLTRYDDIVSDMLLYFSQQIAAARAHGIDDIIIDPGFGFAKTLEQNYEVLSKLELFKITGLPLLAGMSRKSMIYKLLGVSAQEALNGTTALNTVALIKGASILRVHDVKEAVETVRITSQLKM